MASFIDEINLHLYDYQPSISPCLYQRGLYLTAFDSLCAIPDGSGQISLREVVSCWTDPWQSPTPLSCYREDRWAADIQISHVTWKKYWSVWELWTRVQIEAVRAGGRRGTTHMGIRFEGGVDLMDRWWYRVD